jgi:HTH-type transcriptional regulator / antitoxin HigA
MIMVWFGYGLSEHMPRTTKSMLKLSDNMEWKIIKTQKDYQKALKRLDVIFDAKKNTKEGDELELLGLLIDNYEKDKFPIDLPDPIEAIKFRMEQLGYKQKDLAEAIGLKSRVSEILNRKRKLTLDMVRKIHEALGIPTDILIREY